MFPGALQIFQNALQSGDQESAKKFIRDLNIAWASKSVEVDLTTLSKDNLGTSLVPEDIYSQPQAGIPVQWNLDLTKSLGTGQICSLNRGFVISKTSI